MFHTGLPIGVWMRHMEMVMPLPMSMLLIFMQHASSNHWLAVACVGAGNIQRHWVKGCKHPYIWDNRDIILCMAVAIWRYIAYN